MDTAPDKLGPFTIEAEIGRGGMGVVYRARDDRLDRRVAIKALTPDLPHDERRLARFRREARLIAQLNHPHIAQVHQLLEHDGALYLVFEYVPGHSLAEILHESGGLGIDRALAVCGQIARALEAAHARGIVHRDLKPGNVRISDDGTAKVLDFGIALGRDDAGAGDGAVTGTPGYMPPEQARGARVDARADIFALGCVLFECLSGRTAFRGSTREELIDATLAEEPDYPSLPESTPGPVLALIRSCLARGPERRPADASTVRGGLESAMGRRSTTPTGFSPAVGVPHNLPQPATSFVGGGRQLEALSGLLAGTRLLTLTGIGGCGKTRLALELARRVMDDFADGAWLVELAAGTNPDLVPTAVATALNVEDRAGRGTAGAIGAHLAERSLLLLLDNCEHLLDPVARLCTDLLRAAPGLRIVATSREGLGAAGETTWRVPSLSLPDETNLVSIPDSEAVALFVDRARAARPAFHLDEENAAIVARICRRLDGIPLALELAAARIRMLTPEEIERRLDDRFRLLTGGPRGGLERHRTLRAVLDWSYRTLTGSEQRMLRRLSVFAGGWTLEAAVAVCGPGGHGADAEDLDDLEVLDVLTRLLDKSLVDVGGEERTRYRLLETLRQYAFEKLEEGGGAGRALDRHLEHFLRLAEEAEPELTGDDQAAWLTALESDHENVLAALERCRYAARGAGRGLRMCRALMRFWLVHGHFETGRDACATALSCAGGDAPADLRAGALHAAGVMAYMLGDYDDAVHHQADALDLLRDLGDRPGIADALNSLGNTAYYRGDLEEAVRLHEESLRIRRELEDAPGIATSLNNLANVAYDRERLDEARRLYEEALEINRATGARAWQAINLNNLGLVAYHEEHWSEAQNLHGESLALRRDLGDRHGIAESLGHLGAVARATGDLSGARRLLDESLVVRRDLGDRLGLAEAMDEAAMLAALTGQHELAARYLGASERLRSALGAPRPRPEQRVLDAHLAVSRDALGVAVFEDVVEAGQALSLDEALTDARAWLDASMATTVERS